MKRLKVISVVGTRPEIIRLSRVLTRLDSHCDHVMVHTGQNYDYELNEVFYQDLELRRPDYFLNSTENSNGVANTIGNLITAMDSVLAEVKPEAMLILGDTNSCLSVIPAKRRKIPIFHMEAGNRCFDQRVPEEINRRIVDHTSDINMPYSTIARDYLLREGFPPDQVIKIGSPMFEVLKYYSDQINASTIMNRLNLRSRQYFVLSAHREENIETEIPFQKIISIANSVADVYGFPIIVSTHPRTQKRIEESSTVVHQLIRLMKPFGFHDYINLQMNSKAVLSDSGTINEESSILNFPAINLREAHERPEGMEETSVMLAGLDVNRVHQCLNILETQGCGIDRTLRLVADYSVPNVSEKVVRIIHSYTDYIKRVVWKQY
jgi:UDP-N-acetylglucosamine 2-epimerase (non-hydrolysing)